MKEFAPTVCEGRAKKNSSTLSTLLDLRRFDCANKQPKKLSLEIASRGRCLCHYLSKYLDSRTLPVALFSTLIIFLLHSVSVSMSQAHYYE